MRTTNTSEEFDVAARIGVLRAWSDGIDLHLHMTIGAFWKRRGSARLVAQLEC